MKQFTDSKGRKWEVVMNTTQFKRVQSRLEINLQKLFLEDYAERLTSDACLLVDVLYVLCETQCKECNVSDEDFGSALVGDAIGHAADALFREVADFFPESRRVIFHKMIDKSDEIAAVLSEKAMTALDNLNSTSLTFATNSADSAELTQVN